MAESSFLQGDHNNATAVPFSDDEAAKPANDSELLEEDSPTDTPEVRAQRRERRQERLSGLLRDGKQSKEELASLRAEAQKTREELAALRGYVAAQPTQRPSNDTGRDLYELQLDAVYARQSEAYNAAQAEIKAGTFTAERQQHYERIAREVESAKTRIHTERVVDSRVPAARAESAQQVWVQKYPEVYQNPKAFQYAQATWQRRQALGDAGTNDLVDEIMAETMAQFKLGKRPAPSQSERTRMSGVPSSGSGGGSARGTGIVMNPTFKRMAAAAYPEMSEADAEKKWVNGPGKKLRDKKVI